MCIKSHTALQTRGKHGLIKIKEKFASSFLNTLCTKASCQRSFIKQHGSGWSSFNALPFWGPPTGKLVTYWQICYFSSCTHTQELKQQNLLIITGPEPECVMHLLQPEPKTSLETWHHAKGPLFLASLSPLQFVKAGRDLIPVESFKRL